VLTSTQIFSGTRPSRMPSAMLTARFRSTASPTRAVFGSVRNGSAGRTLLRPMRSAPRSGLIPTTTDPARRGTATMELTTTAQVSVDGVMQGPGGREEDERGRFERGGWAQFDDEASTVMDEIYQRADAFLFGRRTYEFFAGSWGTWADPGDSPIWTALNTLPKYVASTTLTEPRWANTAVPLWLRRGGRRRAEKPSRDAKCSCTASVKLNPDP
jgi:RibD C-terminal domain